LSKNVPVAERFFAATLMPLSFFRNIMMASGIGRNCRVHDVLRTRGTGVKSAEKYDAESRGHII
jgi:hypothetical protein